jgi:hypothetical protein
MRNSSLKRLPPLMIAISAWLAHPMFGGQITPPNTLLVFTEESSTVLTATTTGGAAFGTVTLISPDFWNWVLPADRPDVGLATTANLSAWSEPGNTGSPVLVNFVTWPPINITHPNGLRVYSDLDSTGLGVPVVSNGTTVTGEIEFFYAGGGSETFDVQFIDNGDTAAVSGVADTGTTCCLLGLSLTGLVFLRWKAAKGRSPIWS